MRSCKTLYISILLLSVLFAGQYSTTENYLSHGLLQDRLYSWEKAGFLINESPVCLPPGQKLYENPQLEDVNGDGALEVLINTTDGSRYYVYQTPYNEGHFQLPANPSINLAAKSLKQHYSSIAPSANLLPPQLNYDSVLGRLPVFKIDDAHNKTYGNLYHFTEDTVSPKLACYLYTSAFSPNGDGFKDEARCVYEYSDDHSSFGVGTFVQIYSRNSGQVICTLPEIPYAMIGVSWNVTWNGTDNSGSIAPEGYYYFKFSGTDEAGNPVQRETSDFLLKRNPPAIEAMNYSIHNTDYPGIVMNKSPQMFFIIAYEHKTASSNSVHYSLVLTKQEDPLFRKGLDGVISKSVTEVTWSLLDDYAKPVEDGFYTVSCQLIDDVGLHSDIVTRNFEVNREPIYPEISAESNIFTPHNNKDSLPDTAKFSIILHDRGVTIDAPYDYAIYTDLGVLVLEKRDYNSKDIEWDGKDTSGNFVADGMYRLTIRTKDNIGNTAEVSETFIKTKIPAALLSPSGNVNIINAVPFIGTVTDPGGDTAQDFAKFEILYRGGAVTDFQLTENLITSPNMSLWQPVSPLPFFAKPGDSKYPYCDSGSRTAFKTRLAFWQPTQNGVYTIMLRTEDNSGFVAAAVRTITINGTFAEPNVVLVSPNPDSIFNIANDNFALSSRWNTLALSGLYSYELNIYAVSGNHKQRIIRNFSKSGNIPESSSQIVWDGKDQYHRYADSGAYCLEVFFYDLDQNYAVRREFPFQINNYYDTPIQIIRYEAPDNHTLIFELSEPASCTINIFTGSNILHTLTINYTQGPQRISLPALDPGFYRVNINVASLANPEDKADGSLSLALDQSLTDKGAGLVQYNHPVEPRIYAGIEAVRVGNLYPEVTASIRVKISGVREIYPYDPYTLDIRYQSLEAFYKYRSEVLRARASADDGGHDRDTKTLQIWFLQNVDIEYDSDSEGTVSRWWYFDGSENDGIQQLGIGQYTMELGGEAANDSWRDSNSFSSTLTAYYKNRDLLFDGCSLNWTNPPVIVSDNQVQTSLFQDKIDNFFIKRGGIKIIPVAFSSQRPDYEKSVTASYWHIYQYYVYHNLFSFGLGGGKPWKELITERRYLWHDGGTTLHHEFDILQQIEYDEQEFIKTEIKDKTKSFDDKYNYITTNILVHSFAEPQLEPFEFELDVPIKGLYKGKEFYSGNLAKYADDILGEVKQTLMIPYKLNSGVTQNKFYPLEMPVSVNTIIYTAEIISSLNPKINAYITQRNLYPELYADTSYAVSWNPTLDPNLPRGTLCGIAPYDPVSKNTIYFSDFYPRDALNRQESMFLIENGTANPNPQVELIGPWSVVFKDIRNLNSTNNIVYAGNISQHNQDSSKDLFSLQLNTNTEFCPEAYFPVYGWIASGYKENGYTLYVRKPDSGIWQSDSTYPELFSPDYQLLDKPSGNLLGFVKANELNGSNTLKIISSGYKGGAEALASVEVGKQVTKGLKDRVYAYDFRSWLDVFPASLTTENTLLITLTPKNYDPDEITIPSGLNDPFGPVYSMKPHGVLFNKECLPILTTVLLNKTTENVDLSRLVVYHLDANNVLKPAALAGLQDNDNDGILTENESGSIASYVEGFSYQFYIPALRKLNFDKYLIYSPSENISLFTHGQPTGNLEGFLDGDNNPILDIPPSTPSGDYDFVLNLTAGQHFFTAREYLLINSHKNIGPMSDPVEIIVDLEDPQWHDITYNGTILGPSQNIVKISYTASEKGTLRFNTGERLLEKSSLKGQNEQELSFPDISEGFHLTTINLIDQAGRTSVPLTINILYDRSAPTGGVMLYPNNGQLLGNVFQLRYVTPTDNLAGVNAFNLETRLPSGNWLAVATLNINSSSLNVGLLGSGLQYLRLQAVDRAGNDWLSPEVTVNLLQGTGPGLDEAKLLLNINTSTHQVVAMSSSLNLTEPGTEIYLFKKLTESNDLAKAVSGSPWLTDANGKLNTVSVNANMLYLIGRKYSQNSQIIAVPGQLPWLQRPVYAGKTPVIVSANTQGEIKLIVSVNTVELQYRPYGASRWYKADYATLNVVPQLLISGVTASTKITRNNDFNYSYFPAPGTVVSVNFSLDTPAEIRLYYLLSKELVTRSITVTSSTIVDFEFENKGVTISYWLEDFLTKNELTFSPDNECYPVTDISYVSINNIARVSWFDFQKDIQKYLLRLYAVSGKGTESLIQTTTSNSKTIDYVLTKNVFYRLEITAQDNLDNLSAPAVYLFFHGNAELLVFEPDKFTDYKKGATEIHCQAGTFPEKMIYAYFQLNPLVINNNIILYAGLELLPAKNITPNLPLRRVFDLNLLDINWGGDYTQLKLYRKVTDNWSIVPSYSYVYDPLYNLVTYTGTDNVTLAVGAPLLKRYLLSGVSANYALPQDKLDLEVYAVNNTNQLVSQSYKLQLVTTDLTILTSIIATDQNGRGIIPVQLGLGRNISYNLTVKDYSGVTGSLTFFAEQMPISFNALVIDGWQRVVTSCILNEGTKYLFELDIDSYVGACISCELDGYIKMQLGSSRQFVFRPDYNDAGTKNIIVKLRDGNYAEKVITLTAFIQNTNRKPWIADNKLLKVAEKGTLEGILEIQDWDNDNFSVQFPPLPPGFYFSTPTNGVIKYLIAPDYDQEGNYALPIVISDGTDIVTETIQVEVLNSNRAPEIINTERKSVLENQLITYNIDILDQDVSDNISLDLNKFPCAAGIVSSQNIPGNIRRFTVWTRPGFVSKNMQSYEFGYSDSYTYKSGVQQFDIEPDLIPPKIAWVKNPDQHTYAYVTHFCLTVSDNVWSTINIRVYRGNDLLIDKLCTIDAVELAPRLIPSLNILRLVFMDGAGNTTIITHNIILENVGRIDPSTGIYLELPIGAYDSALAPLICTHSPTELVDASWQAGNLPYAIAKFTSMNIHSSYDPQKIAVHPLEDLTTLNIPAKFAVKMLKPGNSDQKINPVVWDPVNKLWNAHTAKRLTPEEFGGMSVPTSAFNLGPNEELVYFESPVLGMISLMTFETSERPVIRLISKADYYAHGTNKIYFTVKGNFLRLENTKIWLNGVTLNYGQLHMDNYMPSIYSTGVQAQETVQSSTNSTIAYDPERNLFMITASGFNEGDNQLKVQAENLVHINQEVFNLQVDTTELDIRELYPYPNPAREKGDNMIRFSFILSKPAEVNIRIYTDQGRLLKELSAPGDIGFNAIPWNGIDRWDNQVANGMYLYVISFDDGDKKIIKKGKVGILL